MTDGVSVIVPAYNAGDTVGRTIDSIEPQLGPRDELIVCDDGSTDDTAGIVRTWDCATLIANDENVGLTRTLNTLVGRADGDIVLRVDADTRIDRGVIDRCRRELTTGGEVAWVKIVPSNTEHLHPAASLYGKQAGKTTWFGGACHAVRKNALDAIGGYRDTRTTANADGGGTMNDEMASLKQRITDHHLRERHITDVCARSIFPTGWRGVMRRKWLSAQTDAEQFRSEPELTRLPALKGPLFWTATAASWALVPTNPVFVLPALGLVAALWSYVRGAMEVQAISGQWWHAAAYPIYMTASGLLRTAGAWNAFLRGGSS